MATIDDFGGPQNPLSAPSLSEWAQAVRDALVALQTTDADADARYVNTDGDTMTGALTVANDVRPLQSDAHGQAALFDIRTVSASDIRLRTFNGTTYTQIRMNPVSRAVIVEANQFVVPAPTSATNAPRLARTPNPATGDLGLPGYAGSDTGWRDVSSLLGTGWSVPDANYCALIRRQGGTVFLQFDATSDGSSTTLYSGATGFNPSGPTFVRFMLHDPLAADSTVSPGYYSSSSRWRQRIPTSGRWAVNMAVPTDEAWPTSLPGTQVTPPASWS